MRSQWLSVPIIVGVVLSGCADNEPAGGAASARGTDASAPGTSAASIPGFAADGSATAPKWKVGDWWQYQITYSSGEAFDARIVVAGMDGSNYVLTSDSRPLVLRAAFSHYPTFGPVAKSTLNHMIHGVEVPFFKFPMKNQTWTAQYRDFNAAYESSFAMLPTPKGEVPGFLTTMRNAVDQKVRFVHGWSPVTRYFTSFTWDFDGTAPIDVDFKLKDWGSNLTASVPVVEFKEGVHRAFPAFAVPPATPSTTAPEPRATFTVQAGGTLLVGFFGGAGGQGDFEIDLAQSAGTPPQALTYPWRPSAAGSHFEHHEVATGAAGEWNLVAAGAAQASAFLFVEAYGVTTKTTELVGGPAVSPAGDL
ncbi:MAG: hypothetical protein HYT80_01415 [Euryarchaeota archaeon]|nr:hypothetical protein [Euryarchaeota archaeon]